MNDEEWAERIAERNRRLIELDLEWARAAANRIRPPNWPEVTDEALLIALHKARYDCTDLPDEPRLESARWLREREYTSFTGPLLPEGELPRGPE